MPEKVEGYLTKDGRFYEDDDLCRLEDAKLALTTSIATGLKQDININDFFDTINLYHDEALEYLYARAGVILKGKEIEPNTGPITLED